MVAAVVWAVQIHRDRRDAELVAQAYAAWTAEAEATAVTIFLGKEETTIGEITSKPKDYWYEVELNPETLPQTIIGYDEDGAKVFKLFPEGRESWQV